MTLSFSETLRKNLLIFDGPMGTKLYRHHVFTNRCFEELNLTETEAYASRKRSDWIFVDISRSPRIAPFMVQFRLIQWEERQCQH